MLVGSLATERQAVQVRLVEFQALEKGAQCVYFAPTGHGYAFRFEGRGYSVLTSGRYLGDLPAGTMVLPVRVKKPIRLEAVWKDAQVEVVKLASLARLELYLHFDPNALERMPTHRILRYCNGSTSYVALGGACVSDLSTDTMVMPVKMGRIQGLDD